jgi:hypothetical protein
LCIAICKKNNTNSVNFGTVRVKYLDRISRLIKERITEIQLTICTCKQYFSIRNIDLFKNKNTATKKIYRNTTLLATEFLGYFTVAVQISSAIQRQFRSLFVLLLCAGMNYTKACHI